MGYKKVFYVAEGAYGYKEICGPADRGGFGQF